MSTSEELDTAWHLFNLLEKLSKLLYKRYRSYLLERHLEAEDNDIIDRILQEEFESLCRQSEKPHNSSK